MSKTQQTATSQGLNLYSQRDNLPVDVSPSWVFRLWINQLCLHFLNKNKFICKLFQLQLLFHMLGIAVRPSKKAFLSFTAVKTHSSKAKQMCVVTSSVIQVHLMHLLLDFFLSLPCPLTSLFPVMLLLSPLLSHWAASERETEEDDPTFLALKSKKKLSEMHRLEGQSRISSGGKSTAQNLLEKANKELLREKSAGEKPRLREAVQNQVMGERAPLLCVIYCELICLQSCWDIKRQVKKIKK